MPSAIAIGTALVGILIGAALGLAGCFGLAKRGPSYDATKKAPPDAAAGRKDHTSSVQMHLHSKLHANQA